MCVICDSLVASNLAVSVCVYLTDKISKHGKKIKNTNKWIKNIPNRTNLAVRAILRLK